MAEAKKKDLKFKEFTTGQDLAKFFNENPEFEIVTIKLIGMDGNVFHFAYYR